ALKHGVAIEHAARQLTKKDFIDFDFIFAMDKSNYRNILALTNAGDVQKKVRLMREFDPEPNGGEVPDPYHGGEQGFQDVFDILERSVTNFVSYLRETYGNL